MIVKKNIVNNFILLVFLTIILKIILAGFFSSDYQNKIFIPFVDHFIKNLGNTWSYYFYENKEVAFPYPPLMLYLLTPFKYIINFFDINNLFLKNAIFKIPSFILDIIIFITLLKLFPQKKYSVLLIYFFSPIILYAVYIHSQLDLIPTAFLFFSIYFLLKDRIKLSAGLMSAAILCKSNVFIILPLIIIYIFKNFKIKDLVNYFVIILISYFLISYPFLFTKEYQFFVLNSPEQNLIYNTFQAITDKKLLWVFTVLLVIYARFFYYPRINKELLLGYISISFIILLALVYPVPSWYIWIVPFICIYLLELEDIQDKSFLLFYFFLPVYIFYALFIYEDPFLLSKFSQINFLNTKINFNYQFSLNVKNIIFTLLNTTMLMFALLIYKESIRKNSVYKFKKTITIGIGGDSSSGKTFFSNDLEKLIEKNKFLSLDGDGDHKWESGDKQWKKFTHLDPRANKLHSQFDMLAILKSGKSFFKSDYNHFTGKFTNSYLVKPKKIITLTGLHPYYLPKTRKIIDIKVYMNPQENLRKKWKLIRDKNLRKYDRKSILKEIRRRATDSKKYILPQIEFADISFNYKLKSMKYFKKNIDHKALKLKIILNADIVLDKVLEDLKKIKSLKLSHDFSKDLKKQEIIFDGEIPSKAILNLAENNIETLSEFISENILFFNNYRGLRQLFTMLMINNFLKNET